MADDFKGIWDDPTLLAVDAAIEGKSRETWKARNYIGASSIGHECERKLWYNFHHPQSPDIPASGLRAIQDGYESESRMIKRLRAVPGIDLRTIGERGRQIGFSDLNDKFKGHIDGLIHGLIQAPETWHIWEHKAVNEKKQRKLDKLKSDHGEKNALEKWDYIYYCQAILYMHYFELTRHYLTCDSPGGRSTISVRTEANERLAQVLIAKAARIIKAKTEPPRISDDPSWYICKWCDNQERCHS